MPQDGTDKKLRWPKASDWGSSLIAATWFQNSLDEQGNSEKELTTL